MMVFGIPDTVVKPGGVSGRAVDQKPRTSLC